VADFVFYGSSQLILTDSWRTTRLWKIRHIGHSSASLHSIHSFGKVKRSTIFCWFPVYYTSCICHPVAVFCSQDVQSL